jgi:hypothetical protein
VLFSVATVVVHAAGCGGTSVSRLTGPEAFRCTVLLSGPASLPAGASQAPMQVAASQDCAWSASSNAAWLQLDPRTGNGSGSITVGALTNSAAQARTAILTVNEQPWAITQAGAAPLPPLPPVGSAGLSARSTLLSSATASMP